MKFFNGKYYENNKVSLISALLYNVRWVGVFLILINFLPVLEKATSTGLDDETTFWAFVLIIVTVALFVFKKQWQSLCNRFTDFLNERYFK